MLLLALGLYVIAVYFLAKRAPPLFWWLISPIIAALTMATLTAYLSGSWLHQACGDLDVFQTATFISNFQWYLPIAFVPFIIWALVRAFVLKRRMSIQNI